MAFRTESVELPNRATLEYVEQGDRNGLPVIFLHGLGDSWRAFGRVLPHLPRSIRAIAVTQRGQGDASRPASGYRFRDFAEDLAAFMDTLRLPAAAIVGHSSGGAIAQRFAVDHPARTLGVVLIGSFVTLRDNQGVAELSKTVSTLTDPIDPDFVRALQQSTLAQPVPQEFLDTMVQEGLKVPARVWKEALEGFVKDDFSSELGKITATALLVYGDKDAFFTQGDQNVLAEAISDSRLIIYPGAGHSPHWENPERLASDLIAFFDELREEHQNQNLPEREVRRPG